MPMGPETLFIFCGIAIGIADVGFWSQSST
jgi:hypothetical protein